MNGLIANKNTFFLSLFCLLLSLMPVWGGARADDWQAWNRIMVRYRLNSRLSLASRLEYRQTLTPYQAERVGANASLTYRPFRFFELEGFYEFQQIKNSGQWRWRHRYIVGAQASTGYQWLKFSFRERFQQSFFKERTENHLRSRVRVDCLLANSLLMPYFFSEIFLSARRENFSEITRVRYRPGLRIALSGGQTLDLFYCRQNDIATAIHIVGAEWVIEF